MKDNFYTKKLKDTSRPFEKRMMDIGRVPNLATGAAIILYLFYFSGISYAEIGLKGILFFFALAILLVLVMQFLIAPRTNHIITRSISSRLENTESDFEKEQELNSKLNQLLHSRNEINKKELEDTKKQIKEIKDERTELVKDLMHCPWKISIQVVLVFALAMVIFLFALIYLLKIDKSTLIFVFAGYISGLYDGGILSWSYGEKLCTEYTVKLSAMGLNDETIHEDKFYGMRFNTRILVFVILSYVIATTVEILFMIMGAAKNTSPETQLLKMSFLTILMAVVTCILSTFLYRQVTKSSYSMNSTIESFLQGNMREDLTMPVDMSNEMSYNLHLVNEIISYLQDLSSKANLASIGIQQQIAELASTSEEVHETSSSLSEIIDKSTDTMSQNVKTQLEGISGFINDVHSTAAGTKKSVDDGFALLQMDISKIREITQANIDTVSGIKVLSDKIDLVWESIRKIDSLAEKTRIIAFNAELEATAAGERGENFHIVANEIRRLADTITDSTYEIKEKIKLIQDSSDNLIVTSEAGTQQIREGSQFFMTLEEKFRELKLKSDITAEYAEEIQNFISTQDTSFVQISTSLKQINSGYREFAQSTKTMTDSAEVLKEIARQLNSIYTNKSGEA